MDDQNDKRDSEPSFGAPPPPEVSLRTMSSDTKSIEKGEPMPVPENVLPPETNEPVFRPETQSASGLTIESEKAPADGKKLAVWLGVFVGIIALGLIGYFVVYPLISTPEVSPQPSPSPTQSTNVSPHNSLFISPPALTAEINLSNLLYSTIMDSLRGVSAGGNPAGSLQEVVISDENSNQVPFSSFVAAFVTNPAASQFMNWFEDDFTAFVYYDANGAWPGYVAKVRNGVNIDELKSAIGALETADLSKFFISNPGAFSAFKAGNLNGRTTRYAIGSTSGAAFNYGVIDTTSNVFLLISTSYEGLRSATSYLGF
ncbi:MAG TPA: hypothetical protein VJB92_02295 [Candidatus Paceibacterota bacterium]